MKDGLISRSALLEKAWDADTRIGYVQVVDVYDIENAPSVDAKPVTHACWEKKTDDDVWWYACSECDGKIPRDRYGHDYFSTYCPHCGALMDLEYTGDE